MTQQQREMITADDPDSDICGDVLDFPPFRPEICRRTTGHHGAHVAHPHNHGSTWWTGAPWRCATCGQLHTGNGYPCQGNHCPECCHP